MTKAEKEQNRLTKLLKSASVSDVRIEAMQDIIVNVAWMKVKLDEAKDAIKTSNVAIPYDNGGGQTGIRENPLFKGYESLWKSYMLGLNKILDSLPAEVAEEEKKESTTVLQMIRSKHKAV